MTCEHLNKLETELIDNQIEIISRGQAWSNNCREWVYFNCLFTNIEKTMLRLGIDSEIVKIHSHLGTHSGQEYGLVCSKCNDGILGNHPKTVKISTRKIKEYE